MTVTSSLSDDNYCFSFVSYPDDPTPARSPPYFVVVVMNSLLPLAFLTEVSFSALCNLLATDYPRLPDDINCPEGMSTLLACEIPVRLLLIACFWSWIDDPLGFVMLGKPYPDPMTSSYVPI